MFLSLSFINFRDIPVMHGNSKYSTYSWSALEERLNLTQDSMGFKPTTTDI